MLGLWMLPSSDAVGCQSGHSYGSGMGAPVMRWPKVVIGWPQDTVA